MIPCVVRWRSRIVHNVIQSPRGAFHASLDTTKRYFEPTRLRYSVRRYSSLVRAADDNSTSQQPPNDVDHRARPLPTLISLVKPASQSHSNLPSFLDYARRDRLNPQTQVFVGTRYEYLTQKALSTYGFELLRTGKGGDRGVDLVGYWHLPDNSNAGSDQSQTLQTLRVLIQCKRHKGKASLRPSAVRELEGAFLGAPTGWRGKDVLGIMVSTKRATKGVITALRASERGLVWVCLEEEEAVDAEALSDEVQQTDVDETEQVREDVEVFDDATDLTHDPTTDEPAVIRTVDGRVVQLLYNHAARSLGLEGLDVVQRHNLDQPDQPSMPEINLVYRGQPVTGLNDTSTRV